MFEHSNQGTCSSKVSFEIRNNPDGAPAVYHVSFEKGCQGNLRAIGILVEAMEARELIAKLKGLACKSSDGGRTSCADQLARAVEDTLGSR
ncbi:MAG: TIGR03905 family TSCPD domain-containing protein [Treponema sp.]|jgi:uncharacterized protein (TIGR03905 family)|nr:TIGR03905 family TSCPD domain-containing protein [Treponema sp.]